MKYFIVILLITGLCFTSGAFAGNERQRVIKELDNIDNNWNEANFKSWINNGDKDVLKVGENVVFHFSSKQKAYLSILHVDAYGVINVSFPLMTDKGEQTLIAGKTRVLPDSTENYVIEAEPPIGRDSIYILATKQPVDKKALGLSPDETSIPTEEARLFLHDLNRSLSGNRVAVAKIEQKIIGRSSDVGYNQNDVVAVFEKKPVMRSFSRRNNTTSTSPSQQQKMVKSKLNLYINFELGSDQLTDTAKANLDQVGLAFQRKSLLRKKFVLAGHTDDLGDEDYNLALSERRSKTVKNYLTGKYNISPARLTTQGFGETKPIEAGQDEFSRAANRRVEIEEWQPGMAVPTPKPEPVLTEEERDATIEWLDK